MVLLHNAEIVGTGSYVPERVLTNGDLEKLVDTSNDWIVQRSGIRERRICRPDETNATMAAIALYRAIKNSGISPDEIELLIVGTNTSEKMWPSAAGHVAKILSQRDAPSILKVSDIAESVKLRENLAFFDVQAGCTGFNYALSIAEMYVKQGMYRTVAVVGTDKLSAITDYTDRTTCVLFGDGAGAVIVQQRPYERDKGIIRSILGGDYTKRDLLVLNEKNFVAMEGRKIYAFAKNVIVEGCRAILEPDYSFDDVDRIIPHQMNARIIEAAGEELKLLDKIVLTIDRFGNNSAASEPLALDTAVREGVVGKNDLVIFVGVGAGLTYGVNLVRLSGIPDANEKN